MLIQHLFLCASLMLGGISFCRAALHIVDDEDAAITTETIQTQHPDFQALLQAQHQTTDTLTTGAHEAPEDSEGDDEEHESGPNLFQMFLGSQAAQKPKEPELPWHERVWNFARSSYSFLDRICTLDQDLSQLDKEKAALKALETKITSANPAEQKALEKQKTLLEERIQQKEATTGRGFSDSIGALGLDYGISTAKRIACEHVLGVPDLPLERTFVNLTSTMRKMSPDAASKLKWSGIKHAGLKFSGYAQSQIASLTKGAASYVGSFLHRHILSPYVFTWIREKLGNFGSSTELAEGFIQRFIFSDGVRNLIRDKFFDGKDDHPLIVALRHADLGIFGYRAYRVINQIKEKSYNFDLNKIQKAVLAGRLSVYDLRNLMNDICRLSINLTTLLQKHVPNADKDTATWDAKTVLMKTMHGTLDASKTFLEGIKSLIHYIQEFKGFDMIQECISDSVEEQRQMRYRSA